MRFSSSSFTWAALEHQRWQIKFMIFFRGAGVCEWVCDWKAVKTEWKGIAWATTRNKKSRKDDGAKGFWQIDCKAETEMAQEHHKNKFAIIHFDLSSGSEKRKAFWRDTLNSAQPGKNLHFYFHFSPSPRKMCFLGICRRINPLSLIYYTTNWIAFLFALNLVMILQSKTKENFFFATAALFAFSFRPPPLSLIDFTLTLLKSLSLLTVGIKIPFVKSNPSPFVA